MVHRVPGGKTQKPSTDNGMKGTMKPPPQRHWVDSLSEDELQMTHTSDDTLDEELGSLEQEMSQHFVPGGYASEYYVSVSKASSVEDGGIPLGAINVKRVINQETTAWDV